MKKLRKLSLNNLTQNSISQNEQKKILGGDFVIKECECTCTASCDCKYAGPQEGSDDSYYGGSTREVSSVQNATSVNVTPRTSVKNS